MNYLRNLYQYHFADATNKRGVVVTRISTYADRFRSYPKRAVRNTPVPEDMNGLYTLDFTSYCLVDNPAKRTLTKTEVHFELPILLYSKLDTTAEKILSREDVKKELEDVVDRVDGDISPEEYILPGSLSLINALEIDEENRIIKAYYVDAIF